ncbi:ribokinase [Frigoribacterium sp. UYMn621]|jgi:ribokinase
MSLRKSVGAGGKGANQAVAAAALGSGVTFLSCVGEDREGIFLMDVLQARGVPVTNVRVVSGAATGTATILVDPGGENVIIVDQGANAHVRAEDVELYLGTANPAVVMSQLEIDLDSVLAAAKCSKGIFILNPAPMPANSTDLSEILAFTDIIVPNRAELGRLANTQTPITMSDVDHCVAQLDFAGQVVVTLGSDGVAVYASRKAGGALLVPPVEVESVDTSGAGDAFCGALGHGLAAGLDLLTAVSRANSFAAWSTTIYGAQIIGYGTQSA